jgi:hypothetical protein
MNNENQQDPVTRPVEITGLGTRTSASEAKPQSRRCKRCGQTVQGRRKNGYCGDRCRMRDLRDAQRRRLAILLDTLSATVEQIRREVLR